MKVVLMSAVIVTALVASNPTQGHYEPPAPRVTTAEIQEALDGDERGLPFVLAVRTGGQERLTRWLAACMGLPTRELAHDIRTCEAVDDPQDATSSLIARVPAAAAFQMPAKAIEIARETNFVGATTNEIQGAPLTDATRYDAIICSYDWDCATALRVVRCESSFDTTAINPSSGTRGLFQIHPIHAPKWPDYWDAWMVPERNVAMAYELWSQQGWSPWACA